MNLMIHFLRDGLLCGGMDKMIEEEKYKDIPALTMEEELYLLQDKKDRAARKKLIDANMNYVLKIAMRYKDRAPMPHLVKAGTKGLIKAIETFTFDGTRFIAHVQESIKNSINALHNLAEPKPISNKYRWVDWLELPENLKTAQLYIEAVKHEGWILRYVPENLKTPELCLEAVKQDSDALKYVPENLKTPELCLEAVKRDGMMLEYVPEALKTAELCLEAVKNGVDVLQYVPENLKTAEMYFETVKKNGCWLENVPENLKQRNSALKRLKVIAPHLNMCQNP